MKKINFLVLAALTALSLVFTGCDNPVEEVTEPTYYTVTFNSNGGSDVEAQKVESGSKATKPTDPTKTATDKESYAFEGWYTSEDEGTTLSDTAFDFESAITADITLYAKWKATEKATTEAAEENPETPATPETPAVTYSVTIAENIENGTVTASKTSSVAAGETITLTVTPETDYELDSISAGSGVTLNGTGNTRTFTMPESNVTVTAIFSWKWVGTKNPTTAKAVGDIVFNDGSSMLYADFTNLDNTTKNTKKTSAIALIFYKGTGLNSGSDTETVRTLGVGLKHNRNGLKWCINTAKAYNLNIETIQCEPDVGGYTGNYNWTGTQNKNGSNNLEKIATFLDTNNDTSTEANYPAFYFAKNYANQKMVKETESRIAADSTYASGWYLPSLAELFQIFVCRTDTENGFDIDTASSALGGDKFRPLDFGSNEYWSSSVYYDSETEKIYARYFDFANQACQVEDQKEYNYVCAIREFN